DCRVNVDGASARIEVPGSMHDLVRRPGTPATAPRAFTTVDGDFFVKVTVLPYEPPRDPPAEGSNVAYHGAGLFLMGEDGQSIRLERASFERGGRLNSYILNSYQMGEWTPTEEQQALDIGVTCYLFAERRNGQLVTGVSTDNSTWTISQAISFP